MSRARWTRALSHGVLVGFGIVVALGVAEIYARRTYTMPWYMRLVAAQRVSEERSLYRRNALGLRDRDYPKPKPPSRRRILMLGDSFTFGQGVLDDAAIFPKLIERTLNTRPPIAGIAGVDVLNGGLPGSLTNRWVDLLEQVVGSFQPDAVVIVFFLRDGTLVKAKRDVFEPIREEVKERNEASLLYRHLYLFRTVHDAIDRRRVAARYLASLDAAYFGTEQQTRQWRTAQEDVRRMAEIARAHGAVAGLVVFPLLVDLQGRYPFQRICDAVLTFASAQGIPAHDLLPAFRGLDGADLWVSPADQHPNATAHAIAARSMLPFVEELLVTSADARAGS